MTVAKDLTFKQGEQVEYIEVTIKDEDDTVVDLSAVTSIEWQVYNDVSDVVVFKKSLGSGVTIHDAANGVIRITLDATDLEINTRYYTHECKVIAPDFRGIPFKGELRIQDSTFVSD